MSNNIVFRNFCGITSKYLRLTINKYVKQVQDYNNFNILQNHLHFLLQNFKSEGKESTFKKSNSNIGHILSRNKFNEVTSCFKNILLCFI